MTANLLFVIAGAVLIVMALSASVLKRLPLSTSLVYLLVGVAIGSHGAGLVRLDPMDSAPFLERLTEVAVLVSLFTAGLKLSPPLRDARWHLPLRLAFVSMIVTVGLITAAGHFLLGLPLGAAVLLGGILAPTDPVLASDVQVSEPTDRDRLRFSLTGEAGLNDGTAFPFVMLGLGLLGLHELGEGGWRWLAVDVLWASAGGLAIGALLGTLIGRLVVYLRAEHKEAVGLDDFLALGLIALSYGVALLAHAYGFLAVFAAGLALRRIERVASEKSGAGSDQDAPAEVKEAAETHAEPGQKEEIATHPEMAPAFMARAVLGFNEQLERIGEVTVVVLIGAMLSLRLVPVAAAWFVPLLLLAIRPVSVLLGLAGSRTTRIQRGMMCWFGIRGIGSVYYLMYAIVHGLPRPLAEPMIGITFAVITASAVFHGISVTPLMNWYGARKKPQASGGDAPAPAEA